MSAKLSETKLIKAPFVNFCRRHINSLFFITILVTCSFSLSLLSAQGLERGESNLEKSSPKKFEPEITDDVKNFTQEAKKYFMFLPSKGSRDIDDKLEIAKVEDTSVQEPKDSESNLEKVFPMKLQSEITEDVKNFTQEAESYFMFLPSQGARHMDGKLEITKAEAEYSCEVKLFGQLPIQFSLGNQYIGINKTVPVDLPASLMGLSFDVETTLPFFFKNTYFRMGVTPSYYTDSWSLPASSFRIPSRYFVIYQPDSKWTFIAGLAVYPDYKDEVGPIFGFIYKPNERLSFDIIPTRPTVTYDLNEKISLFAEGSFSSEEFEVTRNNIKGVVLMYDDAYAGAGLKFKINKFIHASLSAGESFGRSIQYRDKRGKINIKDGPYGQFRVELDI